MRPGRNHEQREGFGTAHGTRQTMFDEILSLEADFVDQGRADGLEAGAAKGLLEGGEIGCVVHVSP